MNIGRLEPERDRSAAIIVIVTGAIHLALALALLVIMNLPISAQGADKPCTFNLRDTEWAAAQIGVTINVFDQARRCLTEDCTKPEAKSGNDRLSSNIKGRIAFLEKLMVCVKEMS